MGEKLIKIQPFISIKTGL